MKTRSISIPVNRDITHLVTSRKEKYENMGTHISTSEIVRKSIDHMLKATHPIIPDIIKKKYLKADSLKSRITIKIEESQYDDIMAFGEAREQYAPVGYEFDPGYFVTVAIVYDLGYI